MFLLFVLWFHPPPTHPSLHQCYSVIFLLTSNSVSLVSMLRLRSHLLCIECTLPRCSKNTGQLVAPRARGRLRLVTERISRGNILGVLRFFNRGLRQQGSGNIFTSHKNVHLTGFNCRCSLLRAISDVTCDITSIPMSRYSKRLRWFQCHQKLIRSDSIVDQSDVRISPDKPIRGRYCPRYEVTICHDDNCQLCISRGL